METRDAEGWFFGKIIPSLAVEAHDEAHANGGMACDDSLMGGGNVLGSSFLPLPFQLIPLDIMKRVFVLRNASSLRRAERGLPSLLRARE